MALHGSILFVTRRAWSPRDAARRASVALLVRAGAARQAHTFPRSVRWRGCFVLQRGVCVRAQCSAQARVLPLLLRRRARGRLRRRRAGVLHPLRHLRSLLPRLLLRRRHAHAHARRRAGRRHRGPDAHRRRRPARVHAERRRKLRRRRRAPQLLLLLRRRRAHPRARRRRARRRPRARRHPRRRARPGDAATWRSKHARWRAGIAAAGRRAVARRHCTHLLHLRLHHHHLRRHAAHRRRSHHVLRLLHHHRRRRCAPAAAEEVEFRQVFIAAHHASRLLRRQR